MWREQNGRVFPEFGVPCPFCQTEMKPFQGKLLDPFAIDPAKPNEKNSRAMDVHMKCNECHYVDCFGVALSHETYDRMLNAL